ncbi:MAG: hypothetical protein SNH63_07775 [Rikenellaceae bacterium]
MKKLMDLLMSAVRKFTPVDFAIFKIMLVSIGIIIGILFFFELNNHAYLFLIAAVLSLIYICYKLIRYMGKE